LPERRTDPLRCGTTIDRLSKTLAGLTVSAVLVRLTLVVIMPETLMAYEAEQAVNRAALSTVFEELLK